MPSITARDGSSGVVSSLVFRVSPASMSQSTTSVKVPPISTPIRTLLIGARCPVKIVNRARLLPAQKTPCDISLYRISGSSVR